MEIHEHTDEDGSTYITVEEALRVELIDVALFESPQPWLRIFDFEDSGTEVHGSFSISAQNGTWVYKLTRRAWWLSATYEATLIRGPELRHPLHTISTRFRVLEEPEHRTLPDPGRAD